MEKWKFCGLIVALVCLLMFAPVAACHADIGKTVDNEVCTNADITYTITATPVDANGWYVKVVDTLPSGATYVSSSSSGSYNSGAGTVTWIYGPVANVPATMTVTVQYANPGTYKNTVRSWVSPGNSPYNWQAKIEKINIADKTVDTCDEQQVPEFPTLALPVGMMLGFAFIVYSVRSRKED
jgi:uncharacterized repeat protein (TIGR01451 family)